MRTAAPFAWRLAAALAAGCVRAQEEYSCSDIHVVNRGDVALFVGSMHFQIQETCGAYSTTDYLGYNTFGSTVYPGCDWFVRSVRHAASASSPPWVYNYRVDLAVSDENRYWTYWQGIVQDTVTYPAAGPVATWTIGVSGVGADNINPQPEDAEVGEPFNVLNGNASCRQADLVIPAPDLPLFFGRCYNSRDNGGAEFGPGWRASTDWAAISSNASVPHVRLRSGDGTTYFLNRRGAELTCERDGRLRARLEADGGWTFDRRDGGGAMHCDAAGRWQWTDDGWSNRLSALRDAAGRITNLAHSCGLFLGVTWSGSRVLAVALPDNSLRVDYAYSPAGLLTSVVRRAAGGERDVRLFRYNASGLLTNAVNPLGETIVHAYDAGGRCLGAAFGDGTLGAQAVWDTASNEMQVRFPLGGGAQRSRAYRRLASVTPAPVCAADGDALRRVVTIQIPYCAVTGRTDRIQWLSTVPRLDRTDGGGETAVFRYDPVSLDPDGMDWISGGHTASVRSACDDLGRPVSCAFGLDGAAAGTNRTEWHATLDLPLAATDPLGWRTEYAWTNGALAEIREPSASGGWHTTALVWSQGLLRAASDPLGRVTALEYDARGGVRRLVPPAGPALTVSNDALGNVVGASLPGEDGGEREWRFTRDGFGRLASATDPDGIETRLAFDAAGRVTNIVDRAGRRTAVAYGTGGAPLRCTRFGRANGTNCAWSVSVERNLQMEPVGVRDTLGRLVASYARDDAGRVVAVTNVEGRTASVEYGALGLPLAVQRYDGTRKTFVYDADGNVRRIARPGRTNTLAWLPNGLLAGAEDGTAAIGNTWAAPGWLAAEETRQGGWSGGVEFAYDAAGWLTQTLARAAGVARRVAVDAAGREAGIVVACGETAVACGREYGAWNGLPSRVHADGGAVEQRLHWDRLDRLTGVVWRARGRTVREILYGLDVLGRITQRVDRVAGVAAARQYAYDDLDRLVAEAHGDGFAAGYAYDDAGRRTAKIAPRFDVAYTAGAGDRLDGWQVTRADLGSVDIHGRSSEDPAANPRRRFEEARNAAGSVAPAMDGRAFRATLPAEAPGTQTVVVAISDAAGNVGAGTNTFVYSAYTAGEYASDEAGCVTQVVYRGPACGWTSTLAWDSTRRLTGVATNGAEAERYVYGPFGRRIVTVAADGDTTRHLYDGGHVLADLDAAGGLRRVCVHGPGTDELVAMIVPGSAGAAAAVYYAIRDHQNTVWGWTDAGGDVVESYDYDAWGRVLAVRRSDGQTVERSLIGNRYLFQGREYSWATGLYYFRARWYDPVTARWLSPDPIGIAGGLTDFIFCEQDPVNYVDPEGLLQAQASHDFWMQTARNGHAAGGIGGNLQAAGASVMGAIIDMWGTRKIEDSASLSGHFAGLDGCEANAWKYGALAAGQIGLEAAGVFGGMNAAARRGARRGSEIVQRAMSQAELKATRSTGLMRGGRQGTHYVSDAVNSDALRARQRLALPQTPEVRVTMRVPSGRFSTPTRVGADYGMPGGGMQRTASGEIPVEILRVMEY